MSIDDLDDLLVSVFEDQHSRVRSDGSHVLSLPAYAWRWYRVGGADSTLDRSALDVQDDTPFSNAGANAPPLHRRRSVPG